MDTPRRECLRCGRPLEPGAPGAPGAHRRVCSSCAPTVPAGGPVPPARGDHFRVLAAGAPGAGGPAERAVPGAGTVVGGLEIVRALGRGGMGQVLVARDPALDREVAIKFLAPALLADPAAVRRFLREGRALAGIRHPNVVSVHGVGDLDGWPYIVMELVEGVALSRVLREGPLPAEEALRIAGDLASALEASHERGVVHGDVTPANVLLRDPGRTACLIDFGLARRLDGPTRTSALGIAGTLEYMAPEVVARRRRDRRVDVYSFGVLLFEMLAGRTPRTGMETGPFLHALLNEDAPFLRSVLPGAPRALEVLLARLLARAPELRPADGAALVGEIRALRAAPSPGAAPAGAAGVGEPPARPAAPPRDPAEETPLLGRDREYGEALAALGDAASRRGRVVLVEGSAGSGKSRFCREVLRAARSRAVGVLSCAGEPAARSPYGSVRAMLLSAGEGVEALLARALAGEAGNRPLAGAMRWLLDPRSARPDAEPARSSAAAAFQALLRAGIRDRPCVLFADDAHDLDEGSLDLLAGAAESAGTWPLLLLLAFRPPEEARRGGALRARLARLRALEGCTDLPLGPLTEAAVASLVHLGLGVDEEESCRLAPVLHRKCSGNPLYLVESLRLLKSGAPGEGAAGGSRARKRVSSMSIPPRLMEVAIRRIASLPPGEKDALGVVSIEPRGTTSAFVARCLDVPRMKALRLLQGLTRERGMLREEGDRYVVSHAEVRDAAYGELIPELRAAYHGELAEDLVKSGAAAEEPARVGRHLRAAGRKAEALPLLLEAGRRMVRHGSPGDGIDLLDAAMDCRGPEGNAGVELARADALEWVGELDGSRSELERLASAGNRLAVVRLAAFWRNRGEDARALETLDRFTLEGATDLEVAELCLSRSQLESRRGREEAALEALATARSRFRSLPPEMKRKILSGSVSVLWRLSRHDEALSLSGEALAMAEEAGDHDTATVVLHNRALLLAGLGRTEEALVEAARLVERATIVGLDRMIVFGNLMLADLLVCSMRLEDAGACLRLVEPRLGRLRNAQMDYLFAARSCQLALAREDGAGAREWAERGMALAAGVPQKEAGFRVHRVEALLLLGDPGEAVAEARRAAVGFARLGDAEGEEGARALAARALREAGESGPERDLMRDLADPATVTGAVEAAREAPSPAEAARRARRARELARDPATREEVRRLLGSPPPG